MFAFEYCSHILAIRIEITQSDNCYFPINGLTQVDIVRHRFANITATAAENPYEVMLYIYLMKYIYLYV